MRCRAIRARPLLVVLAAAAVAACSPTLDTRGYVLQEAALDQIKPGAQTREDVQRLLGTPSTVAPFDENTWFYMGEKTESLAFFEPELLDRQVIVVHFDQSGTVDDVRRLSAEDGNEVEMVARATPTAGHEMTFLEQLLGNIGRFSGAPNNAPIGGP